MSGIGARLIRNSNHLGPTETHHKAGNSATSIVHAPTRVVQGLRANAISATQ